MKLLSIDVGIKNLAYCLFDNNRIILWDVINLCGQDPVCQTCKKKAKYICPDKTFLCQTHAKKSYYIIPTANLSLKKIKKMKLVELNKLAIEQQIPPVPVPVPAPAPAPAPVPATTNNIKKEDILKNVLAFMTPKMLDSASTVSANDMDLVQLGIALRKAFDIELKNHLNTIDQIVIENQISPIANRMKTLQGMLAQYFIMHERTNIAFVSAANKLKGHTQVVAQNTNEVANAEPNAVDTSSYASRKKEGIRITLQLLNEREVQWLPHFNTHKKKDDLADAFLQGNWYLNK